jgi:hypothetical protein
MKKMLGSLAGILVAAGMAGNVGAQSGYPVPGARPGEYCPPYPTNPSIMPGIPVRPGTPSTPGSPMTPATPSTPGSSQTTPSTSPGTQGTPSDPGTSGQNAAQTDGASQRQEGGDIGGGFGFQGNLTAASGGLASAGGSGVGSNFFGAGVTQFFTTATTTSTTTTQSPLILPGLFTSATVESALPLNRVFFNYGYYDGFQINTGAGPQRGFNLNIFNVGVEQTIVDGVASVYVRAPFLYATQNVSGQSLDGIGDVNAGIKIAMLSDRETGNTLSGGFTVSAPTGRDAVIRATTTDSTTITNTFLQTAPAFILTQTKSAPIITSATTTESLNPTYLQPWMAGLLVLDRLFIQEYVGVIIPTDQRVSTFMNNDVTMGFQIYRGEKGDLVSWVTPLVSAQLLAPVNHQGSNQAIAGPTSTNTTIASGVGQAFPAAPAPTTPAAPAIGTVGFPYQLFMTGGFQVGLGDRFIFSAGVSTPVVGPKGYDVGGTVGFSFLY